MSTQLTHNLSYSIKLPKTTVQSQDVMSAVNKTLTKYYYESHYSDYEANFFNLHQNFYNNKECVTVMQQKEVILPDITNELWVKAINSGLNDITFQSYTHYVIVQKFINYILTAKSTQHFGLVEDVFWKLLVTHPPKEDMFDYYQHIMCDHFVTFNENQIEEQNLLKCLIETLINILKSSSNSDKVSDLDLTDSDKKSKILKDLVINDDGIGGSNKQLSFVNLPPKEKCDRCFRVLNFVYNILETNFIFWLHLKKLKPTFDSNRPIISCLLWTNARDVGIIDKNVKRLFELYKLALESKLLSFSNIALIEKIITLLGEVVRCRDSTDEPKYPFLGTKCDNFVRELSTIFYQRIVEELFVPKDNERIFNFKPAWLRLLLCSKLLTSITGHQCPPDLCGVYDILENIIHSKSTSQTVESLNKPSKSVSCKRKLKKHLSVNAKRKNGKTELHLACEENDVEKVRELLTFPELDVNAIDSEGWTALHLAVFRGSVTCVSELLSFCPDSTQKCVNTRARGPKNVTPLMFAANQGHVGICELLLKHSGSILLQDINESNHSALELSNSPEVTKILKYYKKNNLQTHNSHNINFDPSLQKIVMMLCLELILAYFGTHRTWDVYKTLKHSQQNEEKHKSSYIKWDYMCYHRDIKRNIHELRKLIPKLDRIKEFENLNEIYKRILSFNKIC